MMGGKSQQGGDGSVRSSTEHAKQIIQFGAVTVTGNYSLTPEQAKINQDSHLIIRNLFEEAISVTDMPSY